jgi:3-hydroxybutyryl-CoA dehydratase
MRPFPEVVHTVGQGAIDAYAALSGDCNPLHVDPDYAAAGPFGGVIAHGPIALQVVWEAVAGWLGGSGVPPGVCLDVANRAPTRLGDTLTCRAEPPTVHAGDVVLSIAVVGQDGVEVLQALLVVPRGIVPPD